MDTLNPVDAEQLRKGRENQSRTTYCEFATLFHAGLHLLKDTTLLTCDPPLWYALLASKAKHCCRRFCPPFWYCLQSLLFKSSQGTPQAIQILPNAPYIHSFLFLSHFPCFPPVFLPSLIVKLCQTPLMAQLARRGSMAGTLCRSAGVKPKLSGMEYTVGYS